MQTQTRDPYQFGQSVCTYDIEGRSLSRGAPQRSASLYPGLLVLAQPGRDLVRTHRARSDCTWGIHLCTRPGAEVDALHPGLLQDSPSLLLEVLRCSPPCEGMLTNSTR